MEEYIYKLITAKDLYIQNITVAKHNSSHSDSFQVKFPNVFTNYPLGSVRVEIKGSKIGIIINLLFGNRN